jgi:hypothetical protein
MSVQGTWVRRRKYFRRIFAACADDGYGIQGYHNILEEALKIAKRTSDAIAAMETD